MFTIDLLKGQGIPIKRKPWGAAIAAVAFAVPIFAAITIFGFYLSNRIVIKVVRQEIANYESNIKALSEAVKLQKSMEMEKNKINDCLSEAFSSLSGHTQWSPTLAMVVENIPDSMLLTKLEARQGLATKKVPKKDDPSKMTDVTIPVNTLQMNIIGRMNADNDKAVKNFKDRLSVLPESKLENIRISQKASTFEGQSVVSYDIDCVFEP